VNVSVSSKGRRPRSIGGDAAELYDWFASNGVDEWLPEAADVRAGGGRLTYTSFVWPTDADRGWDVAMLMSHDPGAGGRREALRRQGREVRVDEVGTLFEERSVPLLVPVTDRVRRLFAASRMRLAEDVVL
jgi:hypothetical protein